MREEQSRFHLDCHILKPAFVNRLELLSHFLDGVRNPFFWFHDFRLSNQ